MHVACLNRIERSISSSFTKMERSMTTTKDRSEYCEDAPVYVLICSLERLVIPRHRDPLAASDSVTNTKILISCSEGELSNFFAFKYCTGEWTFD